MARTVRRSVRGFSLIELMVVITIIGLLSTVVALHLFGAVETGRRTKARADLHELETALGIYRLKKGVYPPSLEVLRESLPPDYPGGIVKTLRPDPWGHPYDYGLKPDGTFTLVSHGADGSAGGDGAAADVTEDEPA